MVVVGEVHNTATHLVCTINAAAISQAIYTVL